MLKKSLISQLAITVFALSAFIILIALSAVELSVEDIEQGVLEQELATEASYFKQQISSGGLQRWKTARLDVHFLPDELDDTVLPALQQGHTAPFMGELYENGTTILLRIDQIDTPGGRLYLAQDITTLENREAMLGLTLVGIALVLMLFGLIVSWFISRKLTAKLRKLSHDILRIEPSKKLERLQGDYQYLEFESIAFSFNRFLDAMEQYVQREKSFVKLASHELRTPLSVISGALDVIEQRNELSSADNLTLQRIRQATRSMREDIDVLLQLARGGLDHNATELVNIGDILDSCVLELERSMPMHAGRIYVSGTDGIPVLKQGTPALIRMVFRNLLQNSLRHTRSDIRAVLSDSRVTIRDFDQGLPSAVAQIFNYQTSGNRLPKINDNFQESSFGLLIVQMVCDKLDWNILVAHSGPGGTEIWIEMMRAPQL